MTRVGQGMHFCTVCSTRGSWTFLICVSFLLGCLSFFFFFLLGPIPPLSSDTPSCLVSFFQNSYCMCVNQMALSLVSLNPSSLAGIILLAVFQSGYFLLTCLCIQWPGHRKMLYPMCSEACPMNSSTQILSLSKLRLAFGLLSWVYVARTWAVLTSPLLAPQVSQFSSCHLEPGKRAGHLGAVFSVCPL